MNRSHELLEELSTLLQSKEHQDLLKEMNVARMKYLNLQDDIIESIQGGEERKATELGRATAKVGSGVLDNAEKIKEDQFVELEQTRSEVKDIMFGTILLVVGMIVIATIAGIVISAMIARGISRPVRIVTDGLNEIADGNLTMDLLAVKNKDEIGDMAAAFNKMGTDVANMVRTINTSAVSWRPNRKSCQQVQRRAWLHQKWWLKLLKTSC